MTPVAGAVLAGGRSSRMGRDKALIAIDGQAMAVRVGEALRSGGCRPVVVVGGDARALSLLGFDVVADRWPGEGPLGAIITALEHFATPTVVVSCDVPWLDAPTVRALAPVAGADVVVATTDRDEPMCACWMPAALGVLRQQFDGGVRALHRVLGSLSVTRVQVSPAALRNVNAPGDLPTV